MIIGYVERPDREDTPALTFAKDPAQRNPATSVAIFWAAILMPL
jgi:hypothetical protein